MRNLSKEMELCQELAGTKRALYIAETRVRALERALSRTFEETGVLPHYALVTHKTDYKVCGLDRIIILEPFVSPESARRHEYIGTLTR